MSHDQPAWAIVGVILKEVGVILFSTFKTTSQKGENMVSWGYKAYENLIYLWARECQTAFCAYIQKKEVQ